MHFDPLGSEETASPNVADFAAGELIGRDDRPAPPREGLPKRFRMRHGRHYVDELLGDTPLRTVREIPLSEIAPPPDEPINIDALEQSVRNFGVIEPILVARRGVDHQVIAGMRRLRAARTVGLNTVPCLVLDVDDARYESLRAAVVERVTVPVRTIMEEAAPAERGDCSVKTVNESTPVDPGLATTSLRAMVDADIAGVEQFRSMIASFAADTLSRPLVLERAMVSCEDVIGDAISAVAVEARLRSVRIDATVVAAGRMPLDSARLRAALTGLLQCLLAQSSRPGLVLGVRAELTSIRPALIINCALQDTTPLTDDGLARYFDPDFADHPCGPTAAILLAALARTAKAHGGRVQAHPEGVVTVVIPKPIGGNNE